MVLFGIPRQSLSVILIETNNSKLKRGISRRGNLYSPFRLKIVWPKTTSDWVQNPILSYHIEKSTKHIFRFTSDNIIFL